MGYHLVSKTRCKKIVFFSQFCEYVPAYLNNGDGDEEYTPDAHETDGSTAYKPSIELLQGKYHMLYQNLLCLLPKLCTVFN